MRYMILTVLALGSINFIQMLTCEVRSRNYDVSKLRDSDFHVSPVYLLSCIVPVALGIWTVIESFGNKPSPYFRFCLGTGMVIFGVCVFFLFSRSSIHVSKEQILIQHWRHQEIIPVKAIEEIRVANNSIMVEIDNRRIIWIPLIYKECAKMLALMRYYAAL